MTDRLEWKRAGWVRVLRLLVWTLIAGNGAGQIIRVLDPDRDKDATTWFFVGLGSLMIIGAVSVAIRELRTRVRVVSHGIEIREFGSRFVDWDDIRGFRLRSTVRPDSIVVELEGGSIQRLPVPTSREHGVLTSAVEQLELRRHEGSRRERGPA